MTSLDDLQTTFKSHGAAAAIEKLIDDRKAAGDYQGLFYALLMKKRHELGLTPISTGNNNDVPDSQLDAFENGIREAARAVGGLLLTEKKLPQAWAYFRMIGEHGPVREALEAMDLPQDDDPQPFISIAFHEGVSPKRGFDWLLSRYGMCNAITTVSSGEMPFAADVKHHCVKTLIRALHAELLERLRGEIQAKQGFAPTGKTLKEIIEGRDWLFAEDQYHVDMSHLNAVIQMAGQLDSATSREEMSLARDLCAYGQKLSPRFGFQTDPPFENLYVDYDVYLAILMGEDVDKNLEHFRKKADEADPETIGPYPAEVLVNLLLKIGRTDEALAISKKHLAQNIEGRHTCPSFVELCQQTKNYAALADVAREQGNPINFVASLLAAGK